MDIVFENISVLIVLTVVFLVFYTILLNVYFIHKNGFQITVNCWFCNRNSKVLYAQRNGFECSHCCQYNGFDKEGNYNKVIAAQYNGSLNGNFPVKTKHLSPKPNNGLCEPCNRNQQLKVLQLAKFEPLNGNNYDAEIEHFEKQLEKTYRLCKRCKKTVKQTLRKQSAWIFGNRIKSLNSLRRKGDFKFRSKQYSQGGIKAKFYHSLSFVEVTLFLFSIINVFILCGIDLSASQIVPENIFPSILPTKYVSEFYLNIYNQHKLRLLTYLPKRLKIHNSDLFTVSILSLSVELAYSVVNYANFTFFGTFSKILSWAILCILSLSRFQSDIAIYISTLQIFCSLWLMYSYATSCFKADSKKPKKLFLKHFDNEIKNDCSDIEGSSDEEESLNASSFSYTINNNSPNTASTLNNSFYSTRSTKSAALLNNETRTLRNIELNKHFNDLNLGAFNGTSQSFQRPTSPNPFLEQVNRPQSPNNSLYNFGSPYSSPNSSFCVKSPKSSLFKVQNNDLSVANRTNLSMNQKDLFNQTHRTSPRNIQADLVSVQNFPRSSSFVNLNASNQQQKLSFSPLPNQNGLFSPIDTSSVFSYNPNQTTSGDNLRSKQTSSNLFESPLSTSFCSLSQGSTSIRPTKNLISPPRLSNIKSFHSDMGDNLSMTMYADVPSSTLWDNLNGSHLHQRFVVNSLTGIQSNKPSFSNRSSINNNMQSRSSSSSSGFISNGDLHKMSTKSLPNSRDHSPDRNSILSEPACHYKID